MNRRRAMQLAGGAFIAATAGCGGSRGLSRSEFPAFGTMVGYQLHGVGKDEFREIAERVQGLVARCERLLSLYDPGSEISRLNRDGGLVNADPLFLGLLGRALHYAEVSEGVFDPTVQVLWDWRSEWKAASLAERKALETVGRERALGLVGYKGVIVEDQTVRFAKAGMKVTLNAVAQGFTTDLVYNLLVELGVEHALINIGEYRALGQSPGGMAWTVEVKGRSLRQLVSSRALAVSSGSGYTFDPEGRYNHIFDPTSGGNAKSAEVVAVEANDACEADALATTCALLDENQRQELLMKFGGVELV